MSGHDLVGRELPAFTAAAERGQLQFFAKVTGVTDPVYVDLDTACAAGFPDLPVPPTFFFSLELKRPYSPGVLEELGADQRQVLHGEQRFDYHALAFAGDELVFSSRFVDYYEKKDGALKFLIRKTAVTRNGEPIADLTNVLVVRELELKA